MRQDKKSTYSTKPAAKVEKIPPLRHKNREGTEGNNATQSEPDDSKTVSMLDSGKHSERSPYSAGSQ